MKQSKNAHQITKEIKKIFMQQKHVSEDVVSRVVREALANNVTETEPSWFYKRRR